MTKYITKKDGTPDLRYKQGLNRIPLDNDDMAEKPEFMSSDGTFKTENDDMATPEVKEPIKKEAVLTPEERALADRLSTDYEKEWETITEESMVDFSLDKDPYPLPPEAQKYQNEKTYAFKWVLADPRRVDEVRNLEIPLKWWPCNRTNTPWIPDKYFDRIHGGVQHKDQILMFKPFWMHRRHKDAEIQLGEAKIKAGEVETRNGEKHDWGTMSSGEEHAISGQDQVYDAETGTFFSGEAA